MASLTSLHPRLLALLHTAHIYTAVLSGHYLCAAPTAKVGDDGRVAHGCRLSCGLCMGVQSRAGGRGCSLPGLAAAPFSRIGSERPTVPSQISAQLPVGRRPAPKSAEIYEGTVGPKRVIKENVIFYRFEQKVLHFLYF